MRIELQILLLIPVLYLVVVLYLRIAGYYGIVDSPGYRRSHHTVAIRGGGIVFLIAAVWSGIAGAVPLLFCVGWVFGGLLGLLEDLVKIKPVYRLVLQLVSLSLMLYGFGISGTGFLGGILILFLGVAWVNGFNFMDGINGMLAMYTAVSLATFWMMPELSGYRDAIGFMGAALLVFGVFNIRVRARVFAGDVGSMASAFFLGGLMYAAILSSGEISCLLFFSIYGVDAAGTIILRLIRRENIFKAHRSHLYQLLANERGVPHLIVSGGYALVQLCINMLALPLIREDRLGLAHFLVVVAGMSIVYLIFRFRIIRHRGGALVS